MIALMPSALTANAATSGLKGYVNASSVNVRSGAGTSYSVVKSVSKKASLTLLSNKLYNSSWYHVSLSDGKKGYIHKDYVTIKKNQLFISSSATGYKGYTYTYKLTNTTSKKAKWTSSDKSVATVNSKGVVTCLKKGKTNITVKAGSKKIVSKLTVKKAQITLSKSSAKVFTDSTLTLTATCKKSVTFKSSDTKIAKVNNKGVVTPVSTGTVTITAKSKSGCKATCEVTCKKRTITLSVAKTTLYKGCYAQITASNGKSAYKYKSSDTSVLTVDNSGLLYAASTGTAKITCTSGDLKKSKTFTVKKGDTVNLSGASDSGNSINKGMTLYLKSSTSNVKWSSSNKSVATVDGGFVLAKKQGAAIISAYTSSGESTCLVTVTAARPVRFVYTSQNSVLPGNSVTLYAITDKKRSAVKFDLTDSNGSTSSITTTTKTTSDGRYIWSATANLTTAGAYDIVAYSRTSSSAKWKTNTGAESSVFLNTDSSRKTMGFGERYATTALINDIASFEGFLSTVTPDNLAGGIPTVGYGRVVYAGTTFFNGMTKTEAFAYLVNTVNESGFTSNVNKLLTENNIKFNQYQFDALVDFSYNLGAYAITNNEELLNTLLDTYGKSTYENKGFVNCLSAPLRKGAGTDYATIQTVVGGTDITLIDSTVYNDSWYKVKLSDGTTGYMKKSKITLRTTNTSVRNLNNVSLATFIENYLPYHHSSGTCYYGLLYRRIDETEIFFFGDYTVDGKQNNYGFSYTCSKNSDVTIG